MKLAIASGKFEFILKVGTESLSPCWTFPQRNLKPVSPLAISFPA